MPDTSQDLLNGKIFTTNACQLGSLELVEYVPRQSDSHVELAGPESSFFEFFKQSLTYTSSYCTDTKCCSFLHDHQLSVPLISGDHETPETGLKYPLALFADLQDLPEPAVLHQLAQCFRTRVIPSVPFLSNVPSISTNRRSKHFDLLLCKALLGAFTSKDFEHRHLADKLWKACGRLVTASVAVDNSLGRVVGWLSAVTLLVCCGVMQSDLYRWRETNAINGYLIADLYIMSLDTSDRTQIDEEITSLRCYYLICDTLRSIHFHTSSTVDSTWSTGIGPDCQHDLRNLCTSIMLEGCSPPSQLSTNDYLLILLVLMSTINTLQCSLAPLTSSAVSIRKQATDLSKQLAIRSELSGTMMTSIRGSLQKTRHAESMPFNPHTPFTTDRDYNHLNRLLSQSLAIWQKSFEVHAAQSSTSAEGTASETHSMMTLLFLARVILEGGPAMHMVPALAGYTAEPYETLPPAVTRPCAPHKIGISFNDETVHAALEILESVDAAQSVSNRHDSTAGQQNAVSPMWYPLALFYGALVVWGSIAEGEDKYRTHAAQRLSNRHSLSLRRTLQGFYERLKAIEEDWTCAGKMAEIVNALIK